MLLRTIKLLLDLHRHILINPSQLLNVLLSLLLVRRSSARGTKQANLGLGLSKKFSVLLSSTALENTVHLLERSILGLRQEEPHPKDTNK